MKYFSKKIWKGKFNKTSILRIRQYKNLSLQLINAYVAGLTTILPSKLQISVYLEISIRKSITVAKTNRSYQLSGWLLRVWNMDDTLPNRTLYVLLFG